jgi:ferredoxin
VAIRVGTQHRAFIKIEKYIGKKGKSLDSYFTLNMASNDPKFKGWQPATNETIAKLESEIQNRFDLIPKIIMNKESIREKDSDYIIPVNFAVECLVLLGMAYAEYNGAKDYFYSDSKCTGCGTCEKVVCPGKLK